MTDLDKIIKSFEDIGVDYKLNKNNTWQVIVLTCTDSIQHRVELVFDKKGTYVSKKKKKETPKPIIRPKVTYYK